MMWQLLLSALFGLLAGLVGTAFQAHLQRRERSEERLERRRELKRQKAEEIYSELESVKARSSAAVYQALRASHDMAEDPLAPVSTGVDIDRLKALLRMYFPSPDVEAILAKFDNAFLAASKEHSAELEKLDESLAVKEQLKMAQNSTLAAAKKTNTAVIEAIVEVRFYMDHQVPKLF